MKFDSHPTILVFGTQALAVILILMGIVRQRSDFHSERPQIEQRGDVWDSEIFRARLWEDPFRPLLEPDKKSSSQEQIAATEENRVAARFWYDKMSSLGQVLAASGQAQAVSEAEQVINKQAAEIGVERTQPVQVPLRLSIPRDRALLLIVSLNGRNSPEASELRLRSRYAMISALLVSGYRSASGGGLVPFQDHNQSKELAALDFNRRAVLEWFQWDDQSKALPFKNVVLLWVDDKIPVSPQETSDLTLVSSKTIEALKDAMPSKIGSVTDVIIFDLGSSDRLRGLYQAASIEGDQASYASTIPVPIYFLRASLSDELLEFVTNGGQRPGNVCRLAQQDDRLLLGAIGELKQRLPELQNGCPPDRRLLFGPEMQYRFILVVESDTSFSRGLIEEAEEALNNADITNIDVDVYTYLRGLDGKVEKSSSADGKENTSAYGSVAGAVKSALESRFLSEPTSGSSQFDYLRRLAIKIRREEEEQKTGRVLAVGILGSDVYDKLLVLQALRPELPQALFFTTDMDALYLHAGDEDATRNLIVASANDLDPDVPVDGASPTPADSWHVPPMRDSYEVSLFQATKNVALGNELDEPREDQVSLFEIGAGVYEPLERINTTASQRGLMFLASRSSYLAFPIGILLALWILSSVLAFKSPVSQPKTVSLRTGARTIFVLCFTFFSSVLLAVGFLFGLRWLHIAPENFLEEPVSWTSGVSLWPSLLIRLAAIVVALLLMRIASRNVQRAFFNLQDALEISPASKCDTLRSLFYRILGWPPYKRLADIQRLAKYLGNHKLRLLRIALLAIAYWGFSLVLFISFPPNVPGRGGVILVIDRIVLAFGVGLYIVHLLYCLDVHFMGLLLLRSLRQCFSDSRTNVLWLGQHKAEAYAILESAGEYTDAAGRTLLYPFTVLVLIMLSRIHLFDAWRMTPSLWVTLVIGAALLGTASLALVREAVQLRKTALKEFGANAGGFRDEITALKIGAFAKWYQQPIFAALVSLITVFGTLGLAEPIVRLMVG
jgi:hypothetical protein